MTLLCWHTDTSVLYLFLLTHECGYKVLRPQVGPKQHGCGFTNTSALVPVLYMYYFYLRALYNSSQNFVLKSG